MKLWLVAVAVGFLVSGCANTGVKRQAAPATADGPEPGKGLVIFFRESHFKSGGVGFIVRDLDDQPKRDPFKVLRQPKIGDLPNGSYFVYQATLVSMYSPVQRSPCGNLARGPRKSPIFFIAE